MRRVRDALVTNSGLRAALRRLGVLPHVARLRALWGPAGYEEAVDRALLGALRPGTCVWDVGANVGHYTARFADAVGATGRVVAFEPVATTCKILRTQVGSRPNVIVRNEALGAAPGTVTIVLDSDPASPTNTLVRALAPLEGGGPTASVVVATADDLVETSEVMAPNFVKIDTEGFEEEVLWGMRRLLRSPALHGLMVEVHFGLLEARGQRHAPERIASTLQDAGFSLRWVDPSHLFATRGSPA